MRFDVITLFPELFAPFLRTGVTRRAFDSGAVQVVLWPLREFAQGNYRRVDDRPYGGGPGMVMLPEPLWHCWQAVQDQRAEQGHPCSPTVLFSPQGQRVDHSLIQVQASGPGAILVCGRYEGVDQRFIDQCVDVQWSMGDFVLSGGELPAMAVLDAVARLQPGVLHDESSHQQDSFHPAIQGLLDCPHFTRPDVWSGPKGEAAVPAVLLGGHHGQIEAWRRQQSVETTARLRPDVLARARALGGLTPTDEAHLARAPQVPQTKL